MIKWSKIKWFVNPYYWLFPYFLSFVEEGIRNEKYKHYTGGRVEIWTQWSMYDIDEYRFLTPNEKEFYEFRNKYDFENMSIIELLFFKRKLKKFQEYK